MSRLGKTCLWASPISENTDQSMGPFSIQRAFILFLLKACKGHSKLMQSANVLIRLRGCPGWSEPSPVTNALKQFLCDSADMVNIVFCCLSVIPAVLGQLKFDCRRLDNSCKHDSTCDQETGQCVCAEGYKGYACHIVDGKKTRITAVRRVLINLA